MVSTKLGDQQISSENHESANCRLCGLSENLTLCGFAICGLNLFILFADLKLSQVRKKPFLLTNIAYKALAKFVHNKNRVQRGLLGLFLRQSSAVFTDFMIDHKNLRICYLRTGIPKKFVDLR
jgi:hypothetical protein